MASSGGGDEDVIKQSLMFDRASSSKLTWNPGGGATSYRKWTFSAWVKRTKLGTTQIIFGSYSGSGNSDQDYNILYFGSDDTLRFGAYTQDFIKTNRKFRDVGAWYHIVLVANTLDVTTASERLRMYINGVEETSFATTNYPAEDYNLGVLRGNPHYLGWTNSTHYYDGYMAEVYLIDSLPLTPSSFGETDSETGQWIPKEYEGTFPGESTYVKFVSGAIGTDSSGNSNTWTASNLANSDVMLDTPNNNHCTVNSLDGSGNLTTSQGNTKFHASDTNRVCIKGTFGVTSGKWYYEYTDAASSSGSVGVVNAYATSLVSDGMVGNSSFGWAVNNDGAKENGNSETASYMASFTTGDVIGVALNMDDGEITFYKNGSSAGVAFNNLSGKGAIFPAVCTGSHSGAFDTLNFGQMSFAHTPPTSYKAWNTSNLPTPAIKKPSLHFNPHIYTGTNNTNAITGVGFQPDLVWVKQRDVAYNHQLHDAVRGAAAGLLMSDNNAGENSSYPIASFDSDGFTPASGNVTGLNTGSMVGWFWKANGSGSANTDGSTNTTSTSANTTAGFSIIDVVGTGSSTTYGHGLGVVPKVYIVKLTSGTGSWYVQTSALDGGWDYLVLDTDVPSASMTATAPTSSVITGNITNTATAIYYAWAEVEGFSNFGTYTGNGSTNGPYVNTGFRPSLVMYKGTTDLPGKTNEAGRWQVLDTKRDPSNVADNGLSWNYTNVENSGSGYWDIDILSNGFKLRTTEVETNGSGGIFFYMAFAESPFKYANAR
jgi:hypothetical protein